MLYHYNLSDPTLRESNLLAFQPGIGRHEYLAGRARGQIFKRQFLQAKSRLQMEPVAQVIRGVIKLHRDDATKGIRLQVATDWHPLFIVAELLKMG